MYLNKLFKLLVFLIGLTFSFTACDDHYDELKGDINDIYGQIDELKADIEALKGQVNSIQGIVDAINGGKVVTDVKETEDGRGYVITFNDASTIEVMKKINGSAISIIEVEGVYYWAIVTNGIPAQLLNEAGEPIAVTDNTIELMLDEHGYLTLNGKRVTDANDDFVRFKKGESGAFFKDIIVTDKSVTFVLPDDSQIILNKETGTFLRFDTDQKTPFYLLKPGRETRINIKFSANLKTLEVLSAPEGWTTNVHRANSYVAVTPPADATMGLGELRLQGTDENGLVYLAIARVSVKGSGFADPTGVFILNEGNMTTENGSLIYIDKEGKVLDYAYRTMNGTELGNVTQDIYIFNKKMYIISQNGKTNAVGTGFDNDGMLVVTNSETLVKEATFNEELSALNWPTHIAVLDEKNIFIRDNYGVHLFDSETGTETLIEGSKGAGKLTMAVADGKVFAIAGSKLLVLEKGKTTVGKTIDMGQRIAAVAKANDGNLWVSMQGSPAKIAKVNSKTGENIKTNVVTEVNLSAGVGAGCSITAYQNKLYYSGLGSKIYRHDFETGTTTMLGDVKEFNSEMTMTYNPIAVHPITGHIYMNRIKGYGWNFLINSIFELEDTGNGLKMVHEYRDHTHFPAGIFFPASFPQAAGE